MKILIDMGHPAHAHFFKNIIWQLESNGHEIKITAREKDIITKLLKNYGFKYHNLGKNQNGLKNKAIGMIRTDIKLYKIAKDFKPDILIGVHSPYVAHVSKLLKKPSIIFTDTEHAKLANILTFPFSTAILTPSSFKDDLGQKQIRYKGYHQLAYLHPKYFIPKPDILKEFGLNIGDTFIILRFISWNAHHDVGQHGIQNRIKFVNELEKYGKVLISSEGNLEENLKKYEIKIPPEKLHHLLYYATLYIGEGGTTASEAATLGTHAIHISTTAKYCGVFEDLHLYGLMWTFDDEDGVVDLARELFQKKNLWEEGKERREILIAEKVNVTSFICSLIDNYPQSLRILEENPDMLGDQY